MIAKRTTCLLAAVLGVVLPACGDGAGGSGAGGTGGTASTGGSASACVPGAQAACACLGGTQGIQVCNSDGSAYGPCMGCDTGTGGTGGTTGTTTTAGGTGGTGGIAMGGTGGAPPTMLDLHDAILFDNPTGMADWPVTTTITDLEFQYQGSDGVHVEFSKRDGPERWPDVTPPGWDGPLQYTLGMAEYINGQWYASAAIQYWYGLDESGGNVAFDNQVAKNWYYDSRWGEMAGYQPATGELIGIFVVAGNARGVHDDGSQSPVHERSNVVLVPMPDVNGAQYTF